MPYVAKVVERHEGPSPKSLDSDENLKPEHMLFCCDIKICRGLRTFWKSLGKKKSAFLDQQTATFDFTDFDPNFDLNLSLGPSGS